MAKELLSKMAIDTKKIDSIIFISDEKIFFKSNAAIEVAKMLDGFPNYLKYFQFIPRAIRDIVYDLIAKNRYRFFGKSCAIDPSNQNK
jgi:predicted DCC family thiol-disulfide oxidoreductase YuxK